MVKIVECPRDALQGIAGFIPTQRKAEYLNLLLKAGFHTLDFGSFVAPKAIPQMRDTAEVVKQLDLSHTATRLLAIVANERGAREAATFQQITYLGYPFSISQTFLQRNINATIEDAFIRAANIREICEKNRKELVAYVSMAFGNPYGDHWDVDAVRFWVEKLAGLGVRIISLADTVGKGSPEEIGRVYSTCRRHFPHVEFGLHLHTTLHQWEEKLEAAYRAGCRRFDGVINGLGGCPMAGEKLVGNVNTNFLLDFFEGKNEQTRIDIDVLKKASGVALAFP